MNTDRGSADIHIQSLSGNQKGLKNSVTLRLLIQLGGGNGEFTFTIVSAATAVQAKRPTTYS